MIMLDLPCRGLMPTQGHSRVWKPQLVSPVSKALYAPVMGRVHGPGVASVLQACCWIPDTLDDSMTRWLVAVRTPWPPAETSQHLDRKHVHWPCSS